MFIHSSTRASSRVLSVNTSLCIQTRASLQTIKTTAAAISANAAFLTALKYLIVISVFIFRYSYHYMGFENSH